MRMPFSGRIERAMNLSGERARARGGREAVPADEMERGDGLAMLLAAMITIVPVCLIVLAVLAGVGYLFIAR